MSDKLDMSALVASMEDFRKNTKMPSEIEFPLEITAIKTLASRPSKNVGAWVSVRPIDDKKSYLGVYLGDLIVSIDHFLHVGEKTLNILPHTNPALFVPDLKRIVWGYESWWGIIDSPEKLREITDCDIQNIWYVKALKELEGR